MNSTTLKIIPGVNTAIVDNNKILMIKRVKEPYIGYWSMPGGKIKFAEHVEQAAVRELKEETNIDAEFEKLCGITSEIIYNHDEPHSHFIIFVCKLKHLHTDVKEAGEGKLRWININELDKEKVIPSDRAMIKEFVLKDKKLDIHKVRVKQDGQKYFMEEFTA